MSIVLKRQEKLSSWHSYAPLQRTNVEAKHTIIEKVDQGIFTLDALTSRGWLRTFNFEIDEDIRELIIKDPKYREHYIREFTENWRKPRTTKVMPFQAANSIVVTEESANHFSSIEEPLDASADWNVSPESILQRLQDDSTNEKDRDAAILFAGATAFNDEQRPHLLTALSSYINQNRFTQDDERITVVGSAARKYAMNMDESEFEKYADWLHPGQTDYLNHRVELELVKGICWRLTFERLSSKGTFPKLATVLCDIASGYTNPRMLLQENFAAIALNAIVSVFVLEAMTGLEKHTAKIWNRVIKANRTWFTEMQQQRLVDAIKSIEEHNNKLAESVQRLVEKTCTTRKDG